MPMDECLSGFFYFMAKRSQKMIHEAQRLQQHIVLSASKRSYRADQHYSWILSRDIIKSFEAGIQIINLSNGYLTTLPVEFQELTSLTRLSLNNNRISVIPPVIGRLTSLINLSLEQNQISEIPNWLSQLTTLQAVLLVDNSIKNIDVLCELPHLKRLNLGTNQLSFLPIRYPVRASCLEDLDLSTNKLNTFPTTFFGDKNRLVNLNLSQNNAIFVLSNSWQNFHFLQDLNISGNKLESLPESLSHCSRLSVLKICSNSFSKWPNVLLKLSSLHNLQASSNKFTDLPFWIAEIPRLSILNLQGNKLEIISHALSQMTSLVSLDVRKNKISELPSTLALIEDSLKELLIEGNPLPSTILRAVTCQDIMHILKEQLAAKKRPFHHNVVVAFGEPVSGKTDLFNAMIKELLEANCFFPFKTSAPTSESVKLFEYAKGSQLQPSSPKKEKRPRPKSQPSPQAKADLPPKVEKIKIKMMDFPRGPSGILGCFEKIVRCGVVLLTFDITKPEVQDHIHYWLYSLYAILSSPAIIVVFTFADLWMKNNPTESIADHVNSLMRKYRQLKIPTFWYNWETGENLTPIITHFLTVIEGDERLNKSVPFKYHQFQGLLENVGLSRRERNKPPIITQQELVMYGNACGIPTLPACLQCSKMLHNAGLIFCLAQDTIILNPEWLIDLVYEFLNSSKKQDNGMLPGPAWRAFLSKYPPSFHNSLLSLLDRCEFIQPVHEDIELGVTGTTPRRVLFSPLLLKRAPSQELSESTLSFETGVQSFDRIIKLSILPVSFFQTFLTRVVGRIHGVTSRLNLWTSGMTAQTREGILIKIRTEHNVLELGVSGPNKIRARSLFAAILDIFALHACATNLKWSEFFRFHGTPQDISIFDKFLEEAQTQIEFSGKKLDLFDVIPDQMLIDYPGKRYSLQNLTLHDTLGVGGYSTVHRAQLGDKEVALKILKDRGRVNGQALTEFKQEIDIQGRLNHPNILTILGITLRPFCIMIDLCLFGELYALIHDHKKSFPWELKYKIAMDIASGVQYLHSQIPPIAHLDLKSPNVLLRSLSPKDPVCAKIIDFGTSQYVTCPIRIRKVDNPLWLSPEILMGLPYDHRADTYALGIILSEIVSRQPIFGDVQFISDIAKMVECGRRPTLPESQCPPEYTALIQQCWLHDAEARPDMNHVLQQLSTLQAHHSETDDNIFYSMNRAFEKTLYQQAVKKELEEARLREEREKIQKEQEEDADGFVFTESGTLLKEPSEQGKNKFLWALQQIESAHDNDTPRGTNRKINLAAALGEGSADVGRKSLLLIDSLPEKLQKSSSETTKWKKEQKASTFLYNLDASILEAQISTPFFGKEGTLKTKGAGVQTPPKMILLSSPADSDSSEHDQHRKNSSSTVHSHDSGKSTPILKLEPSESPLTSPRGDSDCCSPHSDETSRRPSRTRTPRESDPSGSRKHRSRKASPASPRPSGNTRTKDKPQHSPKNADEGGES